MSWLISDPNVDCLPLFALVGRGYEGFSGGGGTGGKAGVAESLGVSDYC